MSSMQHRRRDEKRPTRCSAAGAAKLLRAALPTALLLATPLPAWAATCDVSADGVSFGNYDIFSEQSLDGAGSISVTCDVSATYSIALSPGGGSYGARRMSFGPQTLDYNLYDNATRSVIWGDGSAGTAVVSNTAMVATHTVYGRIPARQNVHVGNYTDSITVTLTF